MKPYDKNDRPINSDDDVQASIRRCRPMPGTCNCEFRGTVESFRHGNIVVVDMAGDHWDVESTKLTVNS